MTDDRHGARRVLLAKPRGYCAGVDRAVEAVEEALRRYEPPVYVRKQIVHNNYVVAALEARGAVFVSELDEVPPGATVVFSAHGISPAVREQAAAHHMRTVDATCPLVTKVHNEVRRFADAGYDIVLIGHEGHEEVDGTRGEAPERVQLVQSPEDVSAVRVRDPERVVWLSQTTLSVEETMRTVSALRQRFPHLQSPPGDDICYATQNRQEAVKRIAKECDIVLVVGSHNSSNSRRLVEVALDFGVPTAYLVDHVGEIEPSWLEEASTVGVTSGASVPEILVREVVEWLTQVGFSDVEEVTTKEERLVFAPPRELRSNRSANRSS